MIEKYFGYIGYEHVIETAYGHFKRGRRVVFVGPTGCGKTSLILECAHTMTERRAQSLPMFIPFCNPIKQLILTIAEKLYRRKILAREYLSIDWETLKKRLSREHYQHAFKIILDSIRSYPGLFIGIDNLDQLTPSGRSIVLELINAGAIVCGAATKRTSTLKRVLYQFQEVSVPPMHDSHIRKITNEFLNQEGILVDDRTHFVENVVWKAAGNILALDELLKYFENEPRIRADDLRKVTAGAGRIEVSIEWMIIFAFAFIVMLRFVSRATMNKQLYIITSAIAAVYLGVRYLLAKGNKSENA